MRVHVNLADEFRTKRGEWVVPGLRCLSASINEICRHCDRDQVSVTLGLDTRLLRVPPKEEGGVVQPLPEPPGGGAARLLQAP